METAKIKNINAPRNRTNAQLLLTINRKHVVYDAL